MEKCIICGKPGEKHHIIFRNQGGLDIPINYIYLCSEHHRSKIGPHKNSKIDIVYKINLQKKILTLLNKNYYSIDEIIDIFEMNQNQAQKLTKNMQKYNQRYKRLQILKGLMGGKLYYKYMLDDAYDDSWNVFEDEIYDLEFNLKYVD